MFYSVGYSADLWHCFSFAMLTQACPMRTDVKLCNCIFAAGKTNFNNQSYKLVFQSFATISRINRATETSLVPHDVLIWALQSSTRQINPLLVMTYYTSQARSVSLQAAFDPFRNRMGGTDVGSRDNQDECAQNSTIHFCRWKAW